MPQCGLDSCVTTGREISWETCFLGNHTRSYYHNDRNNIFKEISNWTNLKVISGEKDSIDQSYIYKNSKFCLSLSYPMVAGTSNRLYNILASGGFALVRYFPEIETLFENHKHLVWFERTEEIPEILKYYRDNDEAYNLIKKQGKELYGKKHTARLRIDNIFEIMSGNLDSFQGYIT